MSFYFLSVAIVVIDQFIKQVIHNLMSLGQSVPLIGNLVKLTYVRNTGAAFSLFVGFSSYLALISLIVALAVVYLHHKVPRPRRWVHISLAFILGGSIGNLIDRFFRGYVIDFVDFGFWPVFNFADIMINVGVLIFILHFFEEEVEEVKIEKEEKDILEGLEHVSSTD